MQLYNLTLLLMFLSYYALCSVRTRGALIYFIMCFFVALSILLRVQLPPEYSKDYLAYAQVDGVLEAEITLISLFSEPYRLILYKIIRHFLSNDYSLVVAAYYFNLLVNNIMFIWASRLPDVSLWRKMLFFSLCYLVFAYVWLRASVAYMLVLFLLYYGSRRRMQWIGYFAPLVHMSALPVIYLWVLRNPRGIIKIGMFIALGALVVLFLSSDYAYHIIYKAGQYLLSSEDEKSVFHHVYFGVLLLWFVMYMRVYKNHLNEKFFLVSLFALYVVVHSINVVVGNRVSLFLIAALLFFPLSNGARNFLSKKFANIFSLAFVGIYLFKFMSVMNLE